MNHRAIAACVISNVLKGRSLTQSLGAYVGAHTRQQPLIQEISYGVMRWYPRLVFLIEQLIDKPFKLKDYDIYALLLIGVYQFNFSTAIPDYAIVRETVAACDDLKKPWAKAVVNAILRHYQRRHEHLQHTVNDSLVARYAHPEWFINRIIQDYPHDWQTILAANNVHPPMSLRVNLRNNSRSTYHELLTSQAITATLCPITPTGITLEVPCAVNRLPGFEQGWISVQDSAAQLAAILLDAQPNDRVLDACCAPGGKTGHILEHTPAVGALVAIDKDSSRLTKVNENLRRLQLSAQVMCHDVLDINGWWDGVPFQRILLDAPCSGTGVIRRHPDIKQLRLSSDIATLAAEQLRLLTALWSTLALHGILLYATCSVMIEENEQVISQFLSAHRDARHVPIDTAWGTSRVYGRQLLPGSDNTDGFYYALLQKKSHS